MQRQAHHQARKLLMESALYDTASTTSFSSATKTETASLHSAAIMDAANKAASMLSGISNHRRPQHELKRDEDEIENCQQPQGLNTLVNDIDSSSTNASVPPELTTSELTKSLLSKVTTILHGM